MDANKNLSSTKKVLNPTLIKLGLVSFFADISSEMLYPITPIFLTMVLGASMTSLGFIEGFAEAISSLLKTYSGYWSDKLSRRMPFVAFGYFLSALGKPLIGLSTSWPGVLGARGLDRTGKGLRTAPRDALLADSLPEELRGSAFGWHRAMDTLGAALGPLLTISLLTSDPQNLRRIYFWALIPGLASVIITFLVRESKPSIAKKTTFTNSLKLSEMSTPFRRYLFAWMIFSLVNSSDVFLLMKAKSGGLGLIPVILLYCAYNLIYALFSPYLGQLSDRIGKKKVMLFGLCIFSLVYFGFSMATSLSAFCTLFAVYGLYMAATDGVGKAMAVDLIDPKYRATGLGLLGTMTGLSTIVASGFAGVLWDHLGASAPFIYGGLGSIIAALFLLRIKVA